MSSQVPQTTAIPQSPEAREEYTRILTLNFQTELSNGRNTEACNILLKISEAKASQFALHELQSFLSFFKERGDCNHALQFLNNAMKFQNYHSEIHQELIKKYQATGRLDLAEVEFRRYLEINQKEKKLSARTHVFVGFEGKFDLTTHLVQDLAALAEQQLALEPSDEQLVAAQQAFHVGNVIEAEKLFSQASQRLQYLGSYTAHALALEAMQELSGNNSYMEQSIALLQRITEQFPNSAFAWHRLGKGANRLLSDYDFNLLCQKKAIELDPLIEPAYLEAGEMIIRTEGFVPSAFDHITEYLKLRNQRIESHPVAKMGVRVLDWVNTYAFGHLASLVETYIKMVKLGWFKHIRQTIILAPSSMVANQALLERWRPHFEIITDRNTVYQLRPLARALTVDTAYFMHPNQRAHHLISTRSCVQKIWEDENRSPIISTTTEEKIRGDEALRKMGVPEGAWYVCLHTREPGFKKEADVPYYRHCNVNPETYIAAVQAITARGGWVIRMGEPSMTHFPKLPQVVDYAHSEMKEEWLDVFLYTNARFFLASSTGAYGIVAAAGIPILYTNWSITLPLYEGKNDIFIYKLIHSAKDGRLLNFREAFSPPLFHRPEVHRMYENGYSFIDNTPEEIREAVDEMLERLDGKFTQSTEDLVLQKRFAALLPAEVGPFSAHVASKFLRKYAALLAS